IGLILALLFPEQLSVLSMLGTLFVEALKAVAPVLVFVLVLNAIASHVSGKETAVKGVLVLYIISTFLAGLVAVVVSFIFPTTLTLKTEAQDVAPPSGIGEVLETLLFNIVTNPVTALMEANYLGILVWAVLLGFALKAAHDATKNMITNVSEAVTQIVQWVISFAPIGILGIVYDTISSTGFSALMEYGRLIMILVGTMLFIALVMNSFIVSIATRRNPYPLVLLTLRESGITAFFTRSSAANIPVNMALAEK